MAGHVLSRVQAPSRSLAAAALVVVMGVGSVAMWLAIPASWLWFAGRLSNSYDFAYLTALIACPVTMAGFATLLYRVNAVYLRLTGQPPVVPARAAWLKGMSAERGARSPRGLLELMMIGSAVLAVIAFNVWFFGYAGSPLP